MVAYAVTIESEFSLHLRERKSADLDAMFNDVEDQESNMRASRIQLNTRYYPPERWDYTDRRKGKDPELPPASQEPFSMEDFTKLLKFMANEFTKVK